jgi:Nucleotidyl transferase AbiEii toxin, Type IV TA system
LDRIVTRDKNLPIPGVEALEARIYFRGFYGEENLTLRTQLDITQFEKIYLPIQSRALLHPYPDAFECSATIRCQKMEEILASKLTALLHRRRPGDLFDLLYAIVIAKDYPVSRREVLLTFLRKSIFEPNPGIARNELLSIPIAEFETSWPQLIVPATVAFGFTFVVTQFRSLIESLFSSGSESQSSSVPRQGPGVRMSGPTVAGPRPFGVGIRGTLINAGRNRHMVELLYDGLRRLVEPYKLQYYVRKSDGQGAEYFWGYDISGGTSRTTGIKMFSCDKIQRVTETSRLFNPRFSVEI